jgi:hypothetical protein
MLSWEDLEPLLDELDQLCHNFDHEKIREVLLNAPTGFNPTDGICDLVWEARRPLESAVKPKAQVINLPNQ